MLAPAHKTPSMPTPEKWTAPDATPGQDMDTQWWKQFHDPALDSLIAEALNANADLQLAAANVATARALVTGTTAERFPLIEGQGTAQRGALSAETTQGRLSPNASKPAPDLSLGAVLSYELDLWGRLANADKAARARLLASEKNQDAIRNAVAAETAANYYLIKTLDTQIKITERTIKSRQDTFGVQEKRFESGYEDELILRQAESQLAGAQAVLPALQSQRDQSYNALSVLLGRTPVDIVEKRLASSIDKKALPTLQPLPDVNLSEQILDRPDIIAAEQQLLAANAEIGVARAAYLPRISLSALLGVGSENADTLFNGSAQTWNAGAALAGPLLDFGRAQSIIDQSEAAQKAAYINYQKAVRTAFREVSDALTIRENATERLAAQSKQLGALKRSVELARIRYDSGYSDYLDYLDAERELFTVELDRATTNYTQIQSTIEFYRAIAI